MSITATGAAEAEAPHDSAHGHPQGPLLKLALGAVGVVFGDIGTSPLYAFKETLNPDHGVPFAAEAVLGLLSLVVWGLVVVVTLKYVVFVLRAAGIPARVVAGSSLLAAVLLVVGAVIVRLIVRLGG